MRTFAEKNSECEKFHMFVTFGRTAVSEIAAISRRMLQPAVDQLQLAITLHQNFDDGKNFNFSMFFLRFFSLSLFAVFPPCHSRTFQFLQLGNVFAMRRLWLQFHFRRACRVHRTQML